ncbi:MULTISPECIES: Rieske 2Fe-2S domain-containing protein [Myxococcus]|uniref:Rieske 2Fe-2S domain-containing protein n=1 Tax=Myxococcus llanfairpwllgwyngyllgogerychwyrndrobwllllantysiliogogogochensis TaxID=2590453 RepID=A0A540X7A4_9BACT|nr:MULTISPECIES: Rieske 2Fe-2S domain-containing protein [Myxococcus]NTX08267.1 Rieske 2Fe-2S domain-containing protein [Myxococcus sp. CA040A]TQF17080.1 Rieske 2Fe-2S domain-containing protein [Myxococcus llanfairpwllgwyngyllgogerychwyrndrobwllllantysiliogogogochensis]
MRITFLGHAGFAVETARSVVVMDPWLTERGAFDSAWMQLPRNHHLAPRVRELLETPGRERFLYVSHEHKDHFDPEFLATLQRRDFTVVIPRFLRSELQDIFAKYGCKRVIACEDGREIPFKGGYLKLYVSEQGTNRDSAVMVRGDGQCFINLNDCKLHDRLARITEEEGPIDVFTAQFSGAIWHPTCYEYSPETYAAISLKKRDSKFEAVARALEVVRPRAYLASAGPACFLDPTLFHLNFEKVNIFPNATTLFRFLEQRLPGAASKYLEPMPGDVLDIGSLDFVSLDQERVTQEGFDAYLRKYADDMAPLFRERRRNMLRAEVDEIHARLRVELQRKLDLLDLHERVGMPLYVELTELPERLLRVDFKGRRVDEVSELRETTRYTMKVSAADMVRVLDRKLTWEDFLLSFRLRLSRSPDVYEPILHGFLGVEIEDMRAFCEGVRSTESQRERTVVSVGQKRFSVQRFCPHQGADLAEGWVEEGKYLVCPRHRWQFDLDDGGRCLMNGSTLCAEPATDVVPEETEKPTVPAPVVEPRV